MNEFTFLYHTVLPALLRGTGVTLELIAISIPLGILIGVLSAIGRVYGHKVIQGLCIFHQIIFRGIPLLVQLFMLFYGLAAWGIRLSPFTCAITAFGLCSGAYHAEYIRGAILSIPESQMMAARSLGISKWRAIKSIILPQALRKAIPPCSNEIIYLIKYSSLAYMVTVTELMSEAQVLASRYFKSLEIFLLAGLIYWMLVYIATKFIDMVENKTKIPGFGMEGT